jgi:lipoate-protein ligase A
MENVVSALKANAEKYVSKATKSIRSRVANISEFLAEPMTIEQFKTSLLTSLFEGEKDIPYYDLSEQDWENVRKLADERYRSWEWNYGRSPAFNVRQTKRIEGAGTFDVRLQVEDGIIAGATIYGDFFGRGDIAEFAGKFVGVRYDAQSLLTLLKDIDIAYYCGPVTPEQWLELML